MGQRAGPFTNWAVPGPRGAARGPARAGPYSNRALAGRAGPGMVMMGRAGYTKHQVRLRGYDLRFGPQASSTPPARPHERSNDYRLKYQVPLQTCTTTNEYLYRCRVPLHHKNVYFPQRTQTAQKTITSKLYRRDDARERMLSDV